MTTSFNSETLARLYAAPAAQTTYNSNSNSNTPKLSRTDRKLFRGTAVEVNDSMTTDEVLAACGAAFDVNVTAAYHPFDGVFKASTKHTIWHRSDTGEALGVFGNRRQVIQPRDFVEYFRTFTNNSGERISLDVVGSLDGGRTFYMGAKLTENNVERIIRESHAQGERGFGVQQLFNDQDRSDYWLIITDHYGEARAPKAQLLCNRLICANGMTRQIKTALRGLSHRRSMTESDVVGVLNAGLNQARNYAAVQSILTQTELTPEQFRNSIRKFYKVQTENKLPANVRTIESIYEYRLIGRDLETMTTASGQPNAWRALNALTQYTSRSSTNSDSAFRSQLSGTRGSAPNAYLQQLAADTSNEQLAELVAA